MSPVDLVEALEERGLSSRELARQLNVSPMWVSRRTTGQTPISTEDELLIREALERATDYGTPAGIPQAEEPVPFPWDDRAQSDAPTL